MLLTDASTAQGIFLNIYLLRLDDLHENQMEKCLYNKIMFLSRFLSRVVNGFPTN